MQDREHRESFPTRPHIWYLHAYIHMVMHSITKMDNAALPFQYM